MSAPHESGHAYENSLSAERRRRDGIHYTPPDIAASLVAEAFARARPDPGLCLDPACGAGVFLLAALDALVAGGVEPRVALTRVRGLDIDPEAVSLARHALGEWAARHQLDPDVVPVDAVTVADALIDEWPAAIDVVIGNPPFGGQLRGSTVRTGARPDVAASVLGRRAGYADTAALFMARAVDRMSPAGVVVLMQPMSVLSARDAGIARDFVSARATVCGFLFPDASGFAASVHVCAPVLVVDGGPTERDWCDIAADDLGMAPGPPPSPTVLGDVAEVTAGFREEFYVVARHIEEAGSDDRRPRLVTSGSVEPGRVLWGERPTRVDGRSYRCPVVDVEALARSAADDPAVRRLRARLERRTSPKVLVATQTRIIEAVADPDGGLWPSVPVVSVVPTDPGVDVWDLLAVLSSREATRFMARRSLGTGLASGTMRVSARVLPGLPLPEDRAAWRVAADRLRAGAPVDDPAVLDAMSTAFDRTSAAAAPRSSRRRPARR
jgi:hypothetical protein